MNPPKTDRNKNIMKLRDKKKWTFADIAKEYNIKKQTVHEIYYREKERSQELSTVKT